MTQHKTIRALIWSLLEQGGSKVINLLIQVILARLLAPEAFGVLAILLVVVEIANVLASSGLGMALIQETEVSAISYTTAFWLSTSIAFVLYTIIFFASPLFASFYAMPDLVVYLRVLSIVVFSNAFNSIQRSYLQKAMDFKPLFMANLFAMVASGILGVSLAFAGCGVWSLVAQVIAHSVLDCIAMFVYVPWKPSFAFETREAKCLFSYGWKICATGILGSLYSGISDLVIGKVCTVDGLAYYSQGRKWPNAAMSTISGALQNVMFPAFAALKKDEDAFRSAIKRALEVGQFVVVPLSVLLAVSAESLIVILLTEKWLPCVFIFQITCLSNCVLVLQLVNLRAYMALGASDLYLKLQTVKIALGIVVICGAAIVTQDVNVVALCTCLLAYVDVIGVDMQPAKRVLGFGRAQQLRSTLPSVLTASAAGLVAYSIALMGFEQPIRLLLQVLVFVFAYLLLAKLFKVPGWGECAKVMKKLKDASRLSKTKVTENEQ